MPNDKEKTTTSLEDRFAEGALRLRVTSFEAKDLLHAKPLMDGFLIAIRSDF
jgi:hypothetical protein